MRRRLAGGAELLEALGAQPLERIHRRLQELARIELAPLLERDLAELPGHRHAAVGVDVDLAHAVADAGHDLLDRHAPGLRHLAAVGVDHVLQLLGHRGAAVHHQVRVRQPLVDRRDHVHRQDVAGRRLRELVGAVRGADRDRERIDLGRARRNPAPGRDRSAAARAASLPSAPWPSSASPCPVSSEPRQPSSPSTETPTACASSLTRAGDPDIVLVGGGRLAVGLERAVHHHAGEAVLDRREAGRLVVAVVLVQADGNLGIQPRPPPRPFGAA